MGFIGDGWTPDEEKETEARARVEHDTAGPRPEGSSRQASSTASVPAGQKCPGCGCSSRRASDVLAMMGWSAALILAAALIYCICEYRHEAIDCFAQHGVVQCVASGFDVARGFDVEFEGDGD